MGGATTPSLRHSHFGVAVSDIERSTRFYCGALGFEPAETYQIADGLDKIMELDGVRLRLQFLRRADATLELICYDSPAATGPRERRKLNQYGLTHMSFWVDDLAAAMDLVRMHGGTVHDNTRAVVYGNDMVYCTDPDGVRVELMQPPALLV
ncbi:MAG TPA: VOC family protein [Burkholderiaceae bacterium]|nr:VOC family protein [Burkholderiaceae bacterium]